MNFVRNDRQSEQTGPETFLSLHYHQKEVDPYIITRNLSGSTNNGHQMQDAGDHVEHTGIFFHNGTYSVPGTAAMLQTGNAIYRYASRLRAA